MMIITEKLDNSYFLQYNKYRAKIGVADVL